MTAQRVTIRGAAEPLSEAIELGRTLAPEGAASFDCRFVCYLDELGRPTKTPTADTHFALTFWRSERHGRYRVADLLADPPSIWELPKLLWREVRA